MSAHDQVAPARLSLATLSEASRRPGVVSVRIDPTAWSIGIVHFGEGAFHRAHQAVYTEDAAAASGETRWGIFGVTGRSDAVVRQLQPQDGLYGVLTTDAHASSLRLVGSVRDVAWPGDRSGDVVDIVAAPSTHLATLTITEQAYPVASGGRFDATAPGVAHDQELVAAELRGLPRPDASLTPLGLLARGLARRWRTTAAPFSVVCCDNLARNGAVVRVLMLGLCAGLDEGFLQWLRESVTFPSTMVDRITPATTSADRAAAQRLAGVRDDALVVAEPFSQWVIEDAFAGDRPLWELAGAILTDDVTPYETLKLRVLNTAHLLLAWTGLLRGHDTIAGAVADPLLRDLAMRALDRDVLPTLSTPQGIDLQQYRDQVLERFANPAIAHTTMQVGSNGSVKLPNRVVGTIRERLAAGCVPSDLALIIAAWMAVIARGVDDDRFALADPASPELAARVGALAHLQADPARAVRRLLAYDAVFPTEFARHEGLVAAIVDQLATVDGLAHERSSA